MKIKFMGAAQTVTGSCFIIEANGMRFAVDCGMHQGNAEIEERNWNVAIYEPEKIDFFLITHAHIDHSGLLPRMVQKGFNGNIYATRPTIDLLKIMLLDSAHIQEMEALWKSKKRLRHGDQKIKPLYTQNDAMATFPMFNAVSYDNVFEPGPGIKVAFRDAGHILGASLIEIWIKEDDHPVKLVFTGDIGRPAQLLMEDPSIITEADFLFLESTYGNRNHKDGNDSLSELAEAIAYSYANKEKVIIPAFAVERTQELMYSLFLLAKDGRLPPDMPVFLDSPLAIQATEIFRRHTNYLDEETKALIKQGKDPLNLGQLRLTSSTAESMEINNLKGAAVVISASGMANAGRIKHHLRHNLWREGASVVFVGFQSQGTPGRKIIDGAQKVRLFNEDIVVKAKVFTINGFSAHAGRDQLIEWLGHFVSRNMQVFLVHGEYAAQQTLSDLIKERYGYKVFIPEYLEETTLELGRVLKSVEYPEKASPKVNWNYIIEDIEAKFARLKEHREKLEAKPWVEQTEIRDRFLDIDRIFTEINSEI